MASRLLALGGRPLGITPGGGCLALFTTLLQLATMVRMVSDSSCDTLLMQKPSYFYLELPEIQFVLALFQELHLVLGISLARWKG